MNVLKDRLFPVGEMTMCPCEGPLYVFFYYFSKFDGDNKGISLFVPRSLSSLPDVVSK